MSQAGKEKGGWGRVTRLRVKPQAIAMLFLGLSAGTPILLIFSTLSVWLREAGVERSAVTFFSWAALGYSFKFLWAPLVDLLPLPLLTRMFGRRRSWLFLSQFLVIAAILWMASVDPESGHHTLTIMAFAAVMLGFSSATQDIVIDAYRIECAEESMQALLASMYITGYRIGMLIAGAGSLFLAGLLGTTEVNYDYSAWRTTYFCMAAVMGCGVLTTFVISEPKKQLDRVRYDYSASDYLRFLCLFLIVVSTFAATFFTSGGVATEVSKYFTSTLFLVGKISTFVVEVGRFLFAITVASFAAFLLVRSGFIRKEMVLETYVAPIVDFFKRYGVKIAVLFLALIGFYRLSDIVLGVVANLFYLDMGFTKNTIAGVTKTFGLGMILAGGFLGGLLTIRYGVYKILFLGALLSAATNILFMVLAQNPGDITMLTFVIGADNLSAGIATTAFIAFLSSLTNVSFTAMQYAIFSSLMTLFPKLIGGYSGTMVSSFGYERFFLITAIMGLPVLLLIWVVGRLVQEDMV